MHKDKVILVHNGAMGDFLTIWPTLLALARHWASEADTPLCWAGRAAWLPWASPLGAAPCHGATRQAVEELYTATRWPDTLRHARVIWFCLKKKPVALEHPDLWLLHSVLPNDFSPPRDVLRAALARRGVAWANDWRDTWQRLFGAWSPPPTGQEQRILLFPGAGHTRKQWPLVKYLELARGLRQAGLAPTFVLGPAEVERGMAHDLGQNFPCQRPQDMAALSALVRTARAVAGNDCGPMHLAGMFGVPGVAIFGPSSAQQWGPQGMRTVVGAHDCRPCTQTTTSLACTHGACLRDIGVEQVQEAVLEVVER